MTPLNQAIPPRPTPAELEILTRALAARSPHGARGAGTARARTADRLHDRAEAAADHDREGSGAAGRERAGTRLRRHGFPRRRRSSSSCATCSTGRSGARRSKLVMHALSHAQDVAAGAVADPGAARPARGRKAMTSTPRRPGPGLDAPSLRLAGSRSRRAPRQPEPGAAPRDAAGALPRSPAATPAADARAARRSPSAR